MLGIDPGTTGMGYALLDLTTDPPRLLAHGLVETPRHGSAAEKLLAIAEAIDELIATHKPAFFALERLYFNKNVRTAMAVAEARGCRARVRRARRSLDRGVHTAGSEAIGDGSGGADKRAVQRMIVHILELSDP